METESEKNNKTEKNKLEKVAVAQTKKVKKVCAPFLFCSTTIVAHRLNYIYLYFTKLNMTGKFV